MNEDQLLRRLRQFDLQALAEVYDTYSNKLYVYALRLLGEAFLAEDCVAETFQRLLSALRDGKGLQQDVKPYLYRVAHNWITDLYRRQPIPPLTLEETLLAAAGEGVEAEVFLRLLREKTRAALLRLTAEQRQVVILIHIPLLNPETVLVLALTPLTNLVMAPVLAHSPPLYPQITLATNPQIQETTQALATNLNIPFPKGSTHPKFPPRPGYGPGGTFFMRGYSY